jgi:PBP1b-binding outer membrane lipoprotein LpoB
MFTILVLLFILAGCSGEQSDQSTKGPAKEPLASLTKDAKEVDVALPAFVSESYSIA